MPRRTWIVVGFLVLAVPVVGAAWWLGRPPLAAAPAAPPPLPPASKPVSLPLTGTASCSGRACHGRVEPDESGDLPANAASYTIWATRDKHAQAYEVLLRSDGRAIAERLGIDHPEASERCLACHTNPAVAADRVPLPPALVEERREERRAGVGCEACHGPALDWIEPHKSAAWGKMDDKDRKAEYAHTGMTWLRTPAARARVCAGCHVGDGPATGRPARDVNHDLIAAGHPRLNFEYTAYLANVPRHWREKNTRPGSEAVAWAAGQVVSAAADLDLLASRAKAGPWPEFAVYDCAACHHDIHEPSWRRARSGESSPGTLRPSSWYGALVPIAATAFGKTAPPAMTALRSELTRPLPDRTKIAEQAPGLARELSGLADSLDQVAPTPEQVKALRAELARHGAAAPNPDWDEMEQAALGLFAVNRAYQEGRQPNDADRRADKAIVELVNRLAYPVGYHTAKQFRAREGFDAELRELFRQVSP